MRYANHNDTAEKQHSAVEYRQKKLLDKKDKVARRGCVGIGISSILLAIYLFSKAATVADFIVCFYGACMLSIPMCFVYVLIINEHFSERIDKERYRFCKMTKEKRGWVIH